MTRWFWTTWLFLAVALTGCRASLPSELPTAATGPQERPTPPPVTPTPSNSTAAPRATTPTPPPNPAVHPTTEAGVISGLVRWEGPPPPPVNLDTSDLTITVGGRQVAASPASRLQVQPETRGIANAIVWVSNAPAETDEPPNESLTLTQREGDYHPHVQATRVGSTVELVSTDDRALFHALGAADFVETVAPGRSVTCRLDRPGLVEVRSDLAPWMVAYIRVFEHRYYAVTGADGRFRLPRLPTGTYRVHLWHEGWRLTDRSRFLTAPPHEVETGDIHVDPDRDQGALIEWTLSARDEG